MRKSCNQWTCHEDGRKNNLNSDSFTMKCEIFILDSTERVRIVVVAHTQYLKRPFCFEKDS